MLRPRLQRLVDRVNASPVPVLVEVRRAKQGRLRRWELMVRTAAKPWSGYRVPLMPWRFERFARRVPLHPGSRVLPFQHPGWVSPASPEHEMPLQHVTLDEMADVLGRRATG